MNCVSCGHENLLDRNFCGACGTCLARYCPRCGFRNQASDKYCGGCGVKFVAGAARGAGDKAPPVSEEKKAAGALPSSDLADLLEAAREGAEAVQDEQDAKVSQDDIDALFGD